MDKQLLEIAKEQVKEIDRRETQIWAYVDSKNPSDLEIRILKDLKIEAVYIGRNSDISFNENAVSKFKHIYEEIGMKSDFDGVLTSRVSIAMALVNTYDIGIFSFQYKDSWDASLWINGKMI